MTKKKATSKLTFQGIGQPKKTGNYTPPTPIPGCTDPNALNYDQSANVDDGSCIPIVYGCTVQTDPNTLIDNQNYDPLANVNQVSATDTSSPCQPHIIGCMDPNYLEFDASHTQDTAPTSCVTPIVYGCTDPTASNYDSVNPANVDDGSCVYLGCTDSSAFNHDPTATVDDGSCTYYACDDPNAQNYNPNASPTGPVYFTDNSLCTYTPVTGCMDPNYLEYDPQANINDQSMCINLIANGCTNPLAFNFDSGANVDDGSCVTVLPPDNIPTAYVSTELEMNPPQLPSTQSDTTLFLLSILANTGLYPPSKAEVSLDQTNTGWVWSGTFDPFTSTVAHTGTGPYGIIDFTDVNGVDLGDGDVSGTITYTWLALDGSGTVLHTQVEDIGAYDAVNNVATPNTPLTITMGCMWPTGNQNYQAYPAINFHLAGACVAHVNGCMDANAFNYYPGATFDDGSCVYDGCTDPTASNYVATVTHSTTGDTYNVTIDDGSCAYPLPSGSHANMSISGVIFASGQVMGSTQGQYYLGLLSGTGTQTIPINNQVRSSGGFYVHFLHPMQTTLLSAYLLNGTGSLEEPYTYEVDFYVGCGTTNPCIDPNTGALFPGVTFADEATAGLTTDLGNNFWYPGPTLAQLNAPGYPLQGSKQNLEDFLNTGNFGAFYYNSGTYTNPNSVQNFTTPSTWTNPVGSIIDPSGQTAVSAYDAYPTWNYGIPLITTSMFAGDIPGNSGQPGYWGIRFRTRNALGQLAQSDLVIQIEVDYSAPANQSFVHRTTHTFLNITNP